MSTSPLCFHDAYRDNFTVLLLLYTGMQTNAVYCAVLEVTVSLVSTIVKHLIMKEYSLFIGNYYVSPQLDDYHYTSNIMLCGTLKTIGKAWQYYIKH